MVSKRSGCLKVSRPFDIFPANGKTKAAKVSGRCQSHPLIGGDDTMTPSAFPMLSFNTQISPQSVKVSERVICLMTPSLVEERTS
jgi:hypothetical protein